MAITTITIPSSYSDSTYWLKEIGSEKELEILGEEVKTFALSRDGDTPLINIALKNGIIYHLRAQNKQEIVAQLMGFLFRRTIGRLSGGSFEITFRVISCVKWPWNRLEQGNFNFYADFQVRSENFKKLSAFALCASDFFFPKQDYVPQFFEEGKVVLFRPKHYVSPRGVVERFKTSYYALKERMKNFTLKTKGLKEEYGDLYLDCPELDEILKLVEELN